MSKDMGKVENAMYQWTFTQGNTVNLNEWTIGIPDGFMKINSEEMIPTTHKKRPFELVPIKDKENPECAMVRILPGLLSKGVGADSYEMYHPIAKEGMAALFASSSADTQQKFADSPPRVFYTVWNHLFACILEQETLFGTINCQCLVMSNGTTQIIEVETGVDDADDFDENKKRKLEQSIILWLHTMKPNKTKVDIPTVMFEDGDCLVEVMKGGNLKKFEAAVEQAHREYRISIIGKLHVLKYELGDRKQFLREIVNKILLDGMKVREFYAEKANDFVKRVQKSKVNVDTFIKVLRKLLELMQDDEFAKVTVGIDTIFQQAVSDVNSIQLTGGDNISVLMTRYFETLSMDDVKKFLTAIGETVEVDSISSESEYNVLGYKVLRITATEDQMASILDQLELMGVDVEELEDGMPKMMKERTTPDFDSFVAFDIETTGSGGAANGDGEAQITEIGAVRVVKGEIVDRFDQLANPGRTITPMVSRITHITNEMIADKPSVDVVIKKFYEYVGDSILVGHNIKSSDLRYITKAAHKAGIHFDVPYLDTYILAKKYKNDQKWDKLNLGYLAQQYGFEHKEAHRAWSDAEVNAHIYFELQKLSKD